MLTNSSLSRHMQDNGGLIMSKEDVVELRVSGSTNYRKFAGALLSKFEEGHKEVRVITIGESALSQAIKGIIRASSIGMTKNMYIDMSKPSWKTLITEKGEASALATPVFLIE